MQASLLMILEPFPSVFGLVWLYSVCCRLIVLSVDQTWNSALRTYWDFTSLEHLLELLPRLEDIFRWDLPHSLLNYAFSYLNTDTLWGEYGKSIVGSDPSIRYNLGKFIKPR